MAKQTGLGDNLYVQGVDCSGDIGSVEEMRGGPEPVDVTGIDKSARERLGGVRDGGIKYKAFFNPTGVHPTFSALPTTDQIVTYYRGTTLGNPVFHVNGKQLNYDEKRNEDGSVAFMIEDVANGYGGEWGVNMTAGKRSDTGATTTAGMDFGASSSFGAQAYIQIFTFTGTLASINIQDSNDNAVGDPYVSVAGLGFGAAAGATAFRVNTTPTQLVKRWLRLSMGGTFSQMTFAVSVCRNPTATVF